MNNNRGPRNALQCAALVWIGLVVLLPGCSRWHYVHRADRDAYSILGTRSQVDTLSSPTDLGVLPSPDSRLFDPTPVEAPLLPDPVPRLHTYQIPEGIGRPAEEREELPAPSPEPQVEFASGKFVPPENSPKDARAEWPILLTRLLVQNEISQTDDDLEIVSVAIPKSAWESIATKYRSRIFEFENIRNEYEKSYGAPPPASERDDSRRLDFDDIVRLALLNSREYQTRKEQLYRVALRLSLQHYDYQLKFAPFGNRTGVEFEVRDTSRQSFSQLAVPSQAQLEVLAGTGTDVLSRFANDVLLTFNGPNGFAGEVSSELLFQMTHSVFQNDIRFEPLTQAERNVVYAARSFARFRRTFYRQLASDYYELLNRYRQVEIDAQNYLSLARVYSQREVEFDAGEVARVQIDQIEQNTLSARSSLIGTCNSLADDLDRLKLRIGLPSETPINLDLTQLDAITLDDQFRVKMQLVQRAQARLETELSRENRDDAAVWNLATQLVTRIRETVELRQQRQSKELAVSAETEMSLDDGQGESDETIQTLIALQSWLRVSELRVVSDRLWETLQETARDPNTIPIHIPIASLEFARSVLPLLKGERELSVTLRALSDEDAEMEPGEFTEIDRDYATLAAQVEDYEKEIETIFLDVQLQQLTEFSNQGDALAKTAMQAAGRARTANVAGIREMGLNFEDYGDNTIPQLLDRARQLKSTSEVSLPPIDVDVDAATLAALVRRLDLANVRGALFDEWRGTKLAADDLKSILDLQARQRFISQNQFSQPADFDLDESRTELSITIDTPLNRRRQRNVFREQLLNYQTARRDVMELEDEIKRNIRAELRAIELSREQHKLAVDAAALASERVISTELQLRLGVRGIDAFDYLQAQTAYAASLSAVANRHIDYILGRIDLFTDLEQLQLDADGRWPALHDLASVPQVGLEDERSYGYGKLPWNVHYSKYLRRRLNKFWSVQQQPVENLGLEDLNFEDSVLEDSGFEDLYFEELHFEELHFEDPVLEDSGSEDAGLEDSGLSELDFFDSVPAD